MFPAGPEPSDRLIGHRLVVQVHSPASQSISIRLVGEVRNVTEGGVGGIRAGLEFVGLSDVEREILKVIELLGVGW